MSIRLALYDAATNCERDGATAIIVLKSGVKVSGKLKKTPSGADTAMIIDPSSGVGWATVLIDEIAMVEARR